MTNRKAFYASILTALMMTIPACSMVPVQPQSTAPAPENQAAAEETAEDVENTDAEAEISDEETESSAAETETSAAAESDAPEQQVPEIEAGIYQINKNGNIIPNIHLDAMQELGYEEADLIAVTAGDTTIEMPIGTNYSDVDSGEPICRYTYAEGEGGIDHITLAINGGNIAEALGIAVKETISEDPGYQWIYSEGFDENAGLTISMVEKQGYAEQYRMHKVTANRTTNREDYPDLSDEEYANFRAVATTGIKEKNLYRSSSPINPKIGRNTQADEALYLADIKTVINMVDSESAMESYEGYAYTHYAECDIIPLNMDLDFYSEAFGQNLAEGLRYLGSHEGPYLIHCLEGKDRTGFMAGILECLMGATVEEVVSDYMITYQNYYGVEPGTETYDFIASANIVKILQKTFQIDDLYEAEDLSVCAENYLKGIGLTEEEIQNVKAALSE